VRGTPLHIVNVLLTALESHEGLGARAWLPKLHGPIHGTRQEQVCHLAVLVALALPWVHLYRCEWCMMILEDALDAAILLLALVNFEVFRAHIEVVLLTLGEVEAVSVDRLSVVASTSNRGLVGSRSRRILRLLCHREEGKALGVEQRRRSPIAHLAVVTDRHNIVLVVEADDRHAVDGVLVTVLSQATLLDWLRAVLTLSGWSRDGLFLSADVPLE